MDFVYIVLAALIGYLLGAIPFGFLFVKLTKGIDLRDVGSGRTGGTNSLRAAGLGVGFLTFVMDIVKGSAAVLVTKAILGDMLAPAYLPWAEAAAGVMAVVGHNWSVFLKFGGGAGTGPNVGWAMAVWWPVAVITCIVGGILLLGVGMASVASLAIAALIPIVFATRYFMGVDPSAAYMVGGLITAAIVTWALRPNIKRLLAGEERLVGPAAKRKEKKESA
ncbi:MAG: acyl-phosphate glycerol 3-phosphate acyltransferase [Chloroflexi bacterium]|jgi:glycerol-3-phosphate acyltransferase PlsY|nr:acyl-phosphate glycerol 3-phosphate acyltransferase [Chloroflexota bacterium]